jgi:hypothetical protein
LYADDVRAFAIVIALTATAAADSQHLFVHRGEDLCSRRHHCSVKASWVPTFDGVEISRDRFYALVARPDLARHAHRRRVAAAFVLAGAVALLGLGIYELHDGRMLYSAGLWSGGAATVGVAGSYWFDDGTTAREAQHLLRVGRF